MDFASGRTLQLSGTCALDWGPAGRPGDDAGTGRIAVFEVDQVVAGAGLGLTEAAGAGDLRTPRAATD